MQQLAAAPDQPPPLALTSTMAGAGGVQAALPQPALQPRPQPSAAADTPARAPEGAQAMNHVPMDTGDDAAPTQPAVAETQLLLLTAAEASRGDGGSVQTASAQSDLQAPAQAPAPASDAPADAPTEESADPAKKKKMRPVVKAKPRRDESVQVDVGSDLMSQLRSRKGELDEKTGGEIPETGTLLTVDLLRHLAMFFDLNAGDMFSRALKAKMLELHA